jgi:hypothetical protein
LASAIGAHPDAMLVKFATSKDRQATLWGRKDLGGTKLGLDEDLTPTQQVHKSELWPLFKEAKMAGKRAFWHATELLSTTFKFARPPRGTGIGETYA